MTLRLAAVRRIASEAADAGLLSPQLAACIRRVKGIRRLGVRLRNWLTAEQGRRLVQGIGATSLREFRDHALVALLSGMRSPSRRGAGAHVGILSSSGRSTGSSPTWSARAETSERSRCRRG